MEKKARTEKAWPVDERAASSALAPTSEPRRVIPKDAPAPEIVALAHGFGDSPGRIFRFVHDEIDYGPKWGAGKSPLGTLHEQRGTSWEQAWLLQQLLTAAGVDARFEWGEVEITTAKLVNLTGVPDAFRAGDLLTTAGVPIVLLVDGSQVVGARMSHVWVRAFLDYIPNRGATPGPGDTWIRMDPSLKRFDVGAGVRLDEEVPFDLGEYLQSGTLLSPRAYYEDALAAYADSHNLGVAGLEELKPAKSLIQEAFPFVPASTRAKILTVAGEAMDVPAAFQQHLELQVRETGGGVLLSWSTPWPAVYGRRLELAWPGASSADQAALDLNGGVFATPPYEVDLRPVIRVDGADAASGEEIGSAEDVELLATLTPPQGSPMVARFEMFAGEHAAFTADFGQIPQETIDRYTAGRDAATEPDEEEAWALALAGAVYLRSLSRDLEHLSALRYRRAVQLGNVVLAVRRGAVSRSPDGTPLTFSAAPPSLDLGAMVLGLFPADGVAGPASTSVSTLELLGSQGSAREGEALTQTLGGDHLTAVGFLTRAAREGQTLTRVDATNIEPALAAAELSADAEASVRAGVGRELIAWISETQLPFDTWDTTGYVLEDPSTGAGAYFVTFERLVQGLEANIVFHSPQDLDEVTAPIDVVATLEGEEIESWTLAYRAADGGPAVELASGTGTFANATLAQFDPTLLLNGLYDIVLTARDAAGQSGSRKISVSVEGNMKIGHFTLSFVDLAIPLSGLNLEVVRTYDSRLKDVQGDFGHGWFLDIRQGSYRNNRAPGDGWQILNPGGPLGLPCTSTIETKSHISTIRLSDREIYRFRLSLNDQAPLIGGCQARVVFHFVDGPLPGSTLEILGNDLVIYQNGSDRLLDQDSFETFEPDNVELTTRDGRIFHLNLDTGVTHLEDLNGNAVDISIDGITHSAGAGIDFIRDAEGRIERISDQQGKSNLYAYDVAGDLVQHTDRGRGETQLAYREHFLEEIHNALGVRAVRNDYDDAGRLVRATDGAGNSISFNHDLAARREVITDRLGFVQVMEYDSRGNVVREIDKLGNVTQRSFDGRDNILTETDPLGRTTTYTYTSSNDVASVTDALGNTTLSTYDHSGRLLATTDPRGNVTTNAYDARGNLLSTTDAAGHVTSFTYDASGNQLRQTDALGNVRSFQYDGAGNLVGRTDALGQETTYTYNASGEVTTKTLRRKVGSSSESLTTTYTYNELGRVMSETAPDGSVKSNTYDAMGRIVTSTDEVGRVTTIAYGTDGLLSSVTYPDGTSVAHIYDAEGLEIGLTSRTGSASVMARDAMGRHLSTTMPDGAVTSNTYDAAGQVTAQTAANGTSLEYRYDAAGRLVEITDPFGTVTRAFDAAGNLIASTDPLGNTTAMAYDAMNRRISTTFPDGTSVQTAYDALGRRTSTTDQAGNVTSFEYDAEGRLLKVTDAMEQVTQYSYDELGNLISQTDAEGRTTSFTYDQLGRRTGRTYPGGATESFTYHPDGTVASRTDPNGATTVYTYDANQRLIRRSYPDGSEVTFTYTANGKRQSYTDERGTTSYGYDGRDRVISITYPDGRALHYTYDGLGKRTSMTATVGDFTFTTTYGYDPLSRLVAVADHLGRTTQLGYDGNGNLADFTYPNGVTTTLTYDSLNRLTHLMTEDSSPSVLQSYAITLSPTGNRTGITEASGITRHYTYDEVNRLIRERVEDATTSALLYQEEFAYDSVGNRLSLTHDEGKGPSSTVYEYDQRDRLLSQGAVNYGWDTNGNQVSKDGPNGAAYFWDDENRLAAVTLADGSEVRFSYDPDGVLVRREVTPPDGGPAVVTDYLNDTAGADLSHVVVESVGTSVETVYTRADGRLICLYRPASDSTRFYHSDELGSVRLLTDALGVVTDTYEYSAFGALLSHTGSDLQPYQFAGEPFDPNSQFNYHRARWLNLATGRFTSADPLLGYLSDPMSLHRYLYANADPVGRVDPTGLYSAVNVGLTALTIGLIVAGIVGVTFYSLALHFAPKEGLFTTPPEAILFGGQLGVSTELATRLFKHPIVFGILAGLMAFTGYFGFEILFFRDQVVAYGAGGLAVGVPVANQGRDFYGGLAFNTKRGAEYPGYSFCTSVSVPKIPGVYGGCFSTNKHTYAITLGKYHRYGKRAVSSWAWASEGYPVPYSAFGFEIPPIPSDITGLGAWLDEFLQKLVGEF
jgi:RHS repeat-associated protein